MSHDHFDIQSWADFARGLLAGEKPVAMQEHLDSGCPRCAGQLRAVSRMAALARTDAAGAPPNDAIRVAKAHFSLLHPRPQSRLEEVLLKLVFDSIVDPLPDGARQMDRPDRQLAFESEDYSLQIQVEHRPGVPEATVTGQILDRRGEPLAGVPACLMSGDLATAFGLTSGHGEFGLEAELGEATELRLLVAEDRRIAVGLARQTPS